jgi:hypothetical protein
MKFKNYFIDEDGNIWKEKTLIEASKDLVIFSFDLGNISLDEQILWQTNNVRDYTLHYKRLAECNLKEPIILRSDGYPMDGWHRIIKAISKGVKTLPARRFKIDPKPDIKE